MNLLSRGLYCAFDNLTKPPSAYDAGLVKTHDVTVLIVMQSILVLVSGLVLAMSVIIAEHLVAYFVSLLLGAAVVLFYTCVAAKWVFSFRGAQQARQIYAALWKVQIFKFFLVVAFFLWVSHSSWMKPEAAMLGMGLMQVLPLFSGRSSSSGA